MKTLPIAILTALLFGCGSVSTVEDPVELPIDAGVIIGDASLEADAPPAVCVSLDKHDIAGAACGGHEDCNTFFVCIPGACAAGECVLHLAADGSHCENGGACTAGDCCQ